ncbi:hypothetical protein ACFZAR_33075 [Streptomyces sp. NPDC008222]|uniref:WXG100-like domain-containing protein n=1 Tax=Streptomyces sp. NPDC008222 TaxID=3364820 RepID=UPI0036E573BA
MSINLPPELDWVAKLAVGQDWPKGDEDKLRSLGEAWEDAARQLTAMSREIDPMTSGVLHSIGGKVGDEFSSFTRQLKSNLPDMAEAAGQLGQLGKNTGLQVEYAKYMILAQLIWLAVEIAELAFWAPEMIPALVTGVRAIVKMLLRRLLISTATGVGFMVGMDAVIQGIQFLKGDRTKWDTAATLQAVEGGAIGGAIGGVFSGAGSAFAPKFAASLIGKGLIGGASSIVTTEVMEQIFGGENDMDAAVTSGIIGAMGGGGGRRRFGGGEHNEIHTLDIHLPSTPDIHLPKIPFEGGSGFPGAENFDTGGLGKGDGLGTTGLDQGLSADGPHSPGTGGTRGADTGGTGIVDTGTGGTGTGGTRTGGARGDTRAGSGRGRSGSNGSPRGTTVTTDSTTDTTGGNRGGTTERRTTRPTTESKGPGTTDGATRGTRDTTPRIPATESEGPVTGGSGEIISTPHTPTESAPAPHTSSGVPKQTGHSGGLPGFETTLNGHGGADHTVTAPGEGAPAPVHGGRPVTVTPVPHENTPAQNANTLTQHPSAPAQHPGTTTEGTGPADTFRATPPTTSRDPSSTATNQPQIPHTSEPNRPQEPGAGRHELLAPGNVTDRQQTPAPVVDQSQSPAPVVNQSQTPTTGTNQPQAPQTGTNRPSTESGGAPRPTVSVESPSAPRPGTESAPPRPSPATSDGTSHSLATNHGTREGQDEVAPRAPRPRPDTENGTTTPQYQPSTPPVRQSTGEGHPPALPDVPQHEPGTPPHPQDHQDSTPGDHSPNTTDEQLRRLDTLVVPTHDPDPLHQAPSPPTTRPASPDAGIRRRTADLDRAARAAGMPKDDRDAYNRAVQEAAASGDWDRAGQHLADFRAHVETRTTNQRYEAFHAHAQGGFYRLTNLTGPREEWQSKVDSVEEAPRSDDPDLLDSRLNEYSAEQGYRPIVPDDMYSLFQGGRSVNEMVESLMPNGPLDTGRPHLSGDQGPSDQVAPKLPGPSADDTGAHDGTQHLPPLVSDDQGHGQHQQHDDPADDPAWQHSRDQEPAVPLQHTWVDPVSDPTRQHEPPSTPHEDRATSHEDHVTPHDDQAPSHAPKPGEVDAHTARQTYGMPEKNFKGFREIARDKGLVIDVRPTNPTAPKWLDAGAMAKPQAIKAKTINDADVHLGADPKNIGLVGYFKPKTPDQATVPHGDWDKVVSRYNQRSTEYRELAAKMRAYEADNKFAVKDGVVYGIDEGGTQRPITGDHDLFDISTPGGTRIPHPQHDALIKDMQAKDIAVMHGAHMFWNPPSAFSKSVFDKIVGSHQGPDGEPLLRFSPENEHAELTWTEPLKTGQVNSYTARQDYGIPEKNFKGFREIARDKGLVIDVRPTNPTAPKWLDAGAMAKPQAIKAKTINDADVHLGADPKNIGLVGYFKPKTPDQATVPHGDWDKVVSRYNQRSTEYRELAAKMRAYEADNKFAVKDGVVYGIDEGGTQRPITGDHDLFDISTPGGTRIPHPQHDALIKDMQAKDIAVMHGAHMFWNPPSAFSKSVFDKIVGSHQGPDGEPLLRFSPENEHAELTWIRRPEESHQDETLSDGGTDKQPGGGRDQQDPKDHEDHQDRGDVRRDGDQGHQDHGDHESSDRRQEAKEGDESTRRDTSNEPAERTETEQEPREKPQQPLEQEPSKAHALDETEDPAEEAPKSEPEKNHTPAEDHTSAKDHTSGEEHTSAKDHTPTKDHTPAEDHTPAKDDSTPGDEQQEKPPAPPQKDPAPVLAGRHTESLAGKKITEAPGPDGVRTRIETLLGGHGKDTSVVRRLDAAFDPANFRKQHGVMVNGGWRFTVHVDGRPYEVEVKAAASPWRLDATTDAAKDNDGDGFGVPSESTRESDPRKTEMTSSEAGLEFGPTIVRPVNSELSVLVTPSGKLGGATHGRETTVKSSSQTANQIAFTGKTDSYTSDFTYQVKVTDHQGTQLGAKGPHAPLTGTVRADVPRPEGLADGRPRAWQGWDPARTDRPDTPAAPASRAPGPASGHPVSITGLDTARNAVYEALPREARPDGTAHRDIEDFFEPSNVINEFEHASGWGLLSKPLTLSDGSKAHLHLTVEPDGSQALHTVDDKATLGSKSSDEHGQNRTENSSWSLGPSADASGQVWKAKDSSESTWLTGTAGYTGSSNLTHGAKGKNAIGTESSHEHSGKADLVATHVRLHVQLIRHQLQPGLDGLHGTSTTNIGDHTPPPSEQRPTGAADHLAITIDPQNGEVLRAVPHDGTAPATTGDHPPLDAGRLTGPVTAQRMTFLDFPGSSELEAHIVREMGKSSPGVLPPPEAIHPSTTTAHDGTGAANRLRTTPEAWENLRSLRRQLAPSRLRDAGPKLLDGTYRITLKGSHLPLVDGRTHEILIKAEPSKGDYVRSGKLTTKDVTTRTTGADKSVTRSAKHVVNPAGNVRSSLDHPDVTRGFGIGSLDVTAHNPSHGLTIGTEIEVKRQFSLEADTDVYAHPVTYHVMVGVEDPKQPTTHLSTDAPSPQMQHIQQVKPDGRLTVEVARKPETTDATPPAIPKLDVLPQRHAICHVTGSDDFRDQAKRSLTSAFEKKSEASSPDLKEALDGMTDEDHLRSLVSASHGGWANSGDEQVGSGRNRDTVGLSTRTRLSNFRFHETLPGEGKLEIETKSSGSTAVADKTSRAFNAGLGFDAGRFPSKNSPDASLQVRGGFKGNGGADYNSSENVKQKMTTSRKAEYKGTWHVYEADADITVQGRITDAKGNVTLGYPGTSMHRVVVLLSDDDVRKLGADGTSNTTAPAPSGTRQAPLLTSGLLGGATADIPRSDEILGEIDRQIRKLDTPADVPETALPFAGTFSPENLSANYEDLVGRGILDCHVHESRTQRVITEVLVRGIPRDKWTDDGDHSTGDTTRKVSIAQTVKGGAGHNWSQGADGNFRLSYAPVVKPKPGQDPAEVRAEEKKSGLGSIAWAPSGGGEGSRTKSADSGVTTTVVHKTSEFGDTTKFSNRMRFEVTVTQRTEYGRFVNLAKPRPVDPSWPVHVYVPKSLTETAEQAAARQQQASQQPPQPHQVHDGGNTIEMQPVTGSQADRDRWQASLDSAHDLVGFDNPDALLDHAQTVLTAPRPWSDSTLGKAGSAISWGLGSAASTVGRWVGAMTPYAAHKLVSSFISDPRLGGTDNPLVREQRLPLEQQVSLRQALSSATLPTVFHHLMDPGNGYRTVPLGVDGKTGLEVHLHPTGEAQEISTRDNGNDEITVSTEHESSATASNGLNANLTPLAIPVITKNPAVVVPLPNSVLKVDRDQTFESSSPVTRKPGVPTRTLTPPALPHGKEAAEPGKATLKGPQVLMRQPVRLTTQKYDENGTYGNTAQTDGHVYYWTAKKTEETTTPSTATDHTPTTPDPAKSADDTTQQVMDAEDTKQQVKAPENDKQQAKAPEDTKQQAKAPENDKQQAKAPEDTKQQAKAPHDVESPAKTPEDIKQPEKAHEAVKPSEETSETVKPLVKAPEAPAPVATHDATTSTSTSTSTSTTTHHVTADVQQTKHDAAETTVVPQPTPHVQVPGDGRCLLYSVVASTPPAHWPAALHEGSPGNAHTQHEAVLRQIRIQQGPVRSDSALGRAAEALRQMVLRNVRTTRPEDLPFDVTELYRRSQENQLRQHVQTENFDALHTRLDANGVDHVMSPDWLRPEALRSLYVDARTQELMGAPHHLSAQEAAERAANEVPETTDHQGNWTLGNTALAPRAQFAYVTGRLGPLTLDYIDSHDRLVGAVVDSALHRPLTQAEHRALVRALENWVPGNDAWNTNEGEMFPALVAHTLGVQLRTFQSTGGGTAHLRTVGPEDTGRSTDVYYDGRNHYDASQAPPQHPPTVTEEVAPKAPRAPQSAPATSAAHGPATDNTPPRQTHDDSRQAQGDNRHTHDDNPRTHENRHTPATVAPRRALNHAPRFVVRSAFDARTFRVGDTTVTDLTVRVAFRSGSGHDTETPWQRLQQGAEEYYNRPERRLPDGSVLHVTVERVAEDADPHLVVDVADRDRPMDQRTWWPDADPVAYAHELGHQLGLRDEYRKDDEGPGRAQVPGSLLGDFHQPAPYGLAQGGLRGRHLQLLGALVGDVPESATDHGVGHPEAQEPRRTSGSPDGVSGPEVRRDADHPPLSQDPRWHDARSAAPPVTRRHAWVDPVTDPNRGATPQNDTAVHDPHMPRNEHDAPQTYRDEEQDWSRVLEEYSEERAREYEWLDRLYGDSLDQEAYASARGALLTLRAMDLPRATPDTADRPHLETLARQVLHLDSAPTEDDYRYLLSLTAQTGPESVTDASALAAHFLVTGRGALDDHTALVDGSGHAAGRDWTGSRVDLPDLTKYTVTGPDGQPTEHPAPWHDPYVVTAQGTPDHIVLMAGGRAIHVTDPEEFAALVARDPLRGEGQDILLVVSQGQDHGLAQLIASRAGTAVWSTDSHVRTPIDWQTGTEHLDLHGGSGTWARHLGAERGLLDLFDGLGLGHDSATTDHDVVAPDRSAVAADHSPVAPAHDPGGPGYASYLHPPRDADESALSPVDLVDRLRARPLTTTDYQVIATTPDTVLFEEPSGIYHATLDYRRTSSDNVPLLRVPADVMRQTLVDEHPPLHVSGDLSLAHRQYGLGQQAFATAKAVEAANRQLSLAGSLVRLKADGLTLHVADGKGGHRELVRVTPQFLTRSGKSEEENCRDFAQMVSGGVPASHVVFRDPDGTGAVKAPINALGRTEVTGIHYLAEALSQVADGREPTGPVDPSWAARQVLRDDRLIAESDGPAPGKSYGSALSYDPLDNPRRDVLSDAARWIGINEHAWAEVGETYLVHSINALDENGFPSLAHNYAKPSTPGKRHFGYHFAAVVLSSEDGKHQITLDNIARRAWIAYNMRLVVAENLTSTSPNGFRRLHAAISDELDRQRAGGADEVTLKKLGRHLDLVDALTKAADARRTVGTTTLGSPQEATAMAEYERTVKVAEARMKQAADLPKGSDLWRFRMFSQRPGETMHEVSADLLSSAPSAEANPLTSVIVHGHRLPHVDIGFDQGSRQISKVEARKLTYVAEHAVRAGLWNHHNGLPLPRITVTGRSNNHRPTLGGVFPDGAQGRADAVHRELRDRLDRHLINYQRGSAQPHLTAADFPVTVTTERTPPSGDPEHGRRTTVTVHDPRQGDAPTAPPTRSRRGSADTDVLPRTPRSPQEQQHTAQPQPQAAAHEAAPHGAAPHESVPHESVPQPSYRSERLTIAGFEFEDGSAELTGPQRETVHRLAAEVAWASLANVRAGFPPPRVEVVGHANGMRGGLPHFGEALRRGQARADGVAGLFRSALAVHLARLQADAETVMDPEDIEITTRSAGNVPAGDSASDVDPTTARHRALILIDLPRPQAAQE